MEKEESLVRLRHLHKTYLLGLEGVAALRGVSLDIQAGEFLLVLGNSGGGKSSLLNIIGTIDRQTKGDLEVSGVKIGYNTASRTLAQVRLEHIGFVFQTFNLVQSLSAIENVKLPMILRGLLSTHQIHERAKSLLEEVGLGARLEHFPSQLSGGEQQRVTIARALANEP